MLAVRATRNFLSSVCWLNKREAESAPTARKGIHNISCGLSFLVELNARRKWIIKITFSLLRFSYIKHVEVPHRQSRAIDRQARPIILQFF